jgi:ABC-type Fe3+ transport system permease subunit
MYRRWLLLSGLSVVASAPLHGQALRVEPSVAAARAALRPSDQPLTAPLRSPGAWGIAGDTIDRPHRSRLGTAGLGFLAGAAAGVVVAYFVDRSRDSGEGRLENYIAIPLALGAVTFMTVFVAMGD